MVQSLNTKVDLTIDATFHFGYQRIWQNYDRRQGFEFYNDRDQRKFIQIPLGRCRLRGLPLHAFKGR